MLFPSPPKVALNDPLLPGQVVKDSHTLVSSGQSLSYRYVGVWYKNITVQESPASEKTVMWVGNRDNPLRQESGAAFSLDVRGNLRVYDEQGYSFAVTVVYPNVIVLELLDNGNVVLKHEKSGDDVELLSTGRALSFDLAGDEVGDQPAADRIVGRGGRSFLWVVLFGV